MISLEVGPLLLIGCDDSMVADRLSGKSTLQNELMGDLDAEFGNLPEDAENVSLQSLGSSLGSGFSGQLGKPMSRLVSKLISSKMPAGFNQAAIREYLSSYWGLGKNRQTAIMCFATTVEPPSRLSDTVSAREFLDSIAVRYAKHAEVAISPGAQAGGAVASQFNATVADPASIEAASKEHKAYLMKQFEMLARYLKQDYSPSTDKVRESEAYHQASDEVINLTRSELGEEFIAGIRPKFDPTKVRIYDSYWNWAREDLISLFLDYRSRHLQLESTEATDRILCILSRWDTNCEDLVKFYLSSRNASDQHRKTGELLLRSGLLESGTDPKFKYTKPTTAPKTTVSAEGKIEYSENPRQPGEESNSYSQLVEHGRLIPNTNRRIPYIHLRHRNGDEWQYHEQSTRLLMEELAKGTTSGLSFFGKTVLVTGAGPQSIGADIVKGLLSGGAHVIVTTSRAVSSASPFYNSLYRDSGARGSKLTLLPFNQGSKTDCEALIEHIYNSKSDFVADLDFIVPFAAISESGRELDALDSKSELAHRLMLTNLLRLLGHVKQQKEKRGFDTWPTNVIIPLSPNHGTFGGDGLYAESKIALETLLSRWHSENWSQYLTICGAVIGWTRGTGLMTSNNIVAGAIESLGVITFSQSEMAFNILALMTPTIASLCEDGPIYADLNGGLQFISDLKRELTSARQQILDKSKMRKALLAERVRHETIISGSPARAMHDEPRKLRKRANLDIGFPDLADYHTTTAGLKDLEGMVDLRRVVVIVGYSELGPWGSSRTRWEMEHLGDFTQEGYIEMAWIMGLVKHHSEGTSAKPHSGWFDSKTKEPVQDDEFKRRYGNEILNHSGIRFIEPEALGGYDPNKKESLHEVVVEADLPAFEASKSAADAFRLRHGDKVKITPIPGSEEYSVQVGKGAHFLMPKAAPFDRMVAAQLPKGWNPTSYGIPEDIVSQVDPVTLYALCCVCQALLSAGIEDPFELYKHIHVSELLNCLGSGAGGMLALRDVYRNRYLDRPVQSDIVQESYINAIGAWTNMLLMGSSGPIKSPSGTCATAVESLDIGCEAIQTGKAKMAIVGGSDDFQEEMSAEFGNMKATASSDDQLKADRLPSEMSRPMTSSRSGFVESAGCGVQIIMNAELALEMGVPIYAVVAYTQMAGDKVGRSVPAPGRGLLTAAREAPGARDSPILDLDYRRNNLREIIADIEKWRSNHLGMQDNSAQKVQSINQSADCRIRDALNVWGNDLRKQNPDIAPMRAALATWGLTVDDIQIASLHGTSTQANDKNESNVINQQMEYLGRTNGNPLLAISQKYLTGHPKGPAGAWMLNGCLQVLQTGIVPGNRNADNIELELKKSTHLVYPTQTLHTSGIKAFMLTSFGFGQKGGLVIGIAPRYLFSTIREELYVDYQSRVQRRKRQANRAFIKGLIGNNMFKAKDSSPWQSAGESNVFLDPQARVSHDTINGLSFDLEDMHPRVSPILGGSASLISGPNGFPKGIDTKRFDFTDTT